MDRKLTVGLTLAASLVALAASARAQSLAEVARQEEARRATLGAPSKVFTNSSLSPATLPPVAPAGPVAETPGNSSAARTTVAPTPAEAVAVKAPDEKYWRSRAAAIRAWVAKSRAALAALEGASHAGPREQVLLKAAREQRRATLAEAETALSLMETQADVAKVPKAWLEPAPSP